MAEALRAAGATVELHRDHFAPDAPDVEWLTEAGRRGWVVLTKDDAIRRNPLERRALLAANVRAFILTSQSMSGPDMADLVVPPPYRKPYAGDGTAVHRPRDASLGRPGGRSLRAELDRSHPASPLAPR